MNNLMALFACQRKLQYEYATVIINDNFFRNEL